MPMTVPVITVAAERLRQTRPCTRCFSTWTLELREGALPGRRARATGRHQRARMSKSKIRYTEAHFARPLGAGSGRFDQSARPSTR